MKLTFSEKIRNKTFWLVDFFKGSKVKENLEEIRFVLDTNQNHSEYLKKKLDAILNDAVVNTSFYSHYHGKSIEEFPVVDKNVIRNNTNDFLSKKFLAKERIPVTTSGSTGTPFTTYQNLEKRIRNTADTIYFAEQGGYFIGKKLYYFKIWSDYNKKNILLRYMQNIVAIDVLNLNINLSNFFRSFSKSKSNVAFLGYVSAFETIIKYLDTRVSQKANFSVNSIITMSESLDDYTKSKGQEYFGCPVLSRYSNIENGILAQQTLKETHKFILNTASYYIEILDLESNAVLPYGSLGKIVVTDYYNKAMPLIRYDTGDVGRIEEITINGRSTLVLTHIEGRRLDRIFNAKGELISSYIVYKNMWKYAEINQYQFIQISEKKYMFKISCSEKFTRACELKSEFINYLGDDAEFTIEYVKEIPLLNSGKRKKVVNLYNQEPK